MTDPLTDRDAVPRTRLLWGFPSTGAGLGFLYGDYMKSREEDQGPEILSSQGLGGGWIGCGMIVC